MCGVVTDAALMEFAERASTDKPGRALKVHELLAARATDLAIARLPSELVQRETSPSTISHACDAVSLNATTLMRNSQLPDRAELFRRMMDSAIQDPYWKSKQAFLEFRSQWLERLRAEVLARGWKVGGDAQWRREAIRIPGIVCGLVPHLHRRYASPRWQRALNRWPDRSAAGRWSRTAIWHTLDCLIRDVTPGPNDFEDAHACFAASYGGSLATTDRSLQQLASDVFPSVSVIDSMVNT